MRKNKGSIITNRQYEKEGQAKEKIKECFATGRINSEVAVYILRLLGYSVMRGKEIVKQWAFEKPNNGAIV